MKVKITSFDRDFQNSLAVKILIFFSDFENVERKPFLHLSWVINF